MNNQLPSHAGLWETAMGKHSASAQKQWPCQGRVAHSRARVPTECTGLNRTQFQRRSTACLVVKFRLPTTIHELETCPRRTKAAFSNLSPPNSHFATNRGAFRSRRLRVSTILSDFRASELVTKASKPNLSPKMVERSACAAPRCGAPAAIQV